jgi:adenylosuccinate synthase
LKVSTRAHLIFPWHQRHDALAEEGRGENKIGTTLKGIGPAYADKARRVGIQAGAVADIDSFAVAVRERCEAENVLITQAGGEPVDVDEAVAQFTALGVRLQPYLCDTVNFLHDEMAAGSPILLEGAQATFLDLDHGTYPYVTSSNPTAGGACAGTGLGPRNIDRVVGISKSYTTRVGAGPFPTELTDDLGDRLVDIGREFGTVTGRRRRAGWLDCVMLRHAVRLNSLTELAVTKLDVLDTFETIRVCTGYRIDGHEVANYPDLPEVLERAEPVYAELDGWQSNSTSARTPDDLPPQAQALIRLIEEQVGIPVRIIGVGAERDDYVLWGSPA